MKLSFIYRPYSWGVFFLLLLCSSVYLSSKIPLDLWPKTYSNQPDLALSIRFRDETNPNMQKNILSRLRNINEIKHIEIEDYAYLDNKKSFWVSLFFRKNASFMQATQNVTHAIDLFKDSIDYYIENGHLDQIHSSLRALNWYVFFMIMVLLGACFLCFRHIVLSLIACFMILSSFFSFFVYMIYFTTQSFNNLTVGFFVVFLGYFVVKTIYCFNNINAYAFNDEDIVRAIDDGNKENIKNIHIEIILHGFILVPLLCAYPYLHKFLFALVSVLLSTILCYYMLVVLFVPIYYYSIVSYQKKTLSKVNTRPYFNFFMHHEQTVFSSVSTLSLSLISSLCIWIICSIKHIPVTLMPNIDSYKVNFYIKIPSLSLSSYSSQFVESITHLFRENFPENTFRHILVYPLSYSKDKSINEVALTAFLTSSTQPLHNKNIIKIKAYHLLQQHIQGAITLPIANMPFFTDIEHPIENTLVLSLTPYNINHSQRTMKHISRIVNQSKYVQSVNYLFSPPSPEFSQNNQAKAYLWIVAEQNHLSRLQKYADKILLSEQNPHTFAYQWTDLSAIVKSFDLALQWGFWAMLIVLYAILAMFWNSLTQPIPICLATLFSYGGAIVTLSLFDLSWSIPSFFGLCLSLSINTGHMMHFWADAESRRRASGDLLQAIHQSSRKYFFPVCSYTIIWSIAFLGVFVLAPAPIRDFYWPMFHGFIGPTYVTTIMMIFGLPHLFRAFYNSSASHKVNVVYQSIETTV